MEDTQGTRRGTINKARSRSSQTSKEEAVLTPGAYKRYHSCIFAHLLHEKDLKFHYQQIFDHLPKKTKLYFPILGCSSFFFNHGNPKDPMQPVL